MTRQTFALLALGATLTSGCRYGEVLAFAGGGKATQEDTGNGGSPSPSDDTSGPTDDSGHSPGGSAPAILNVEISLEEYPDISWVAEFTLTYTDADDDVNGGKVEIDAELDGEDPVSFKVPIDGSQAIHDADDGTVFLAVSVNNGSVSGDVSVVLVDAAGMVSDPYDISL